MLNRLIYILAVGSIAISCNKENIGIDKEVDMPTDTTYVVYGVRHLNNTGVTMEVQVDMLKINGLTSVNNYPSGLFSETSYASDVNYSTPIVTQTSIAPGGYNTVLLFNLKNAAWYTEHQIGYYLRRFLEQIDSNPSKKVALSSFSGKDNTKPRFHSENGSVLFENSWQYSMEMFYQITNSPGSSTYNTNFLFFKNQMLDILDTLANSSEISEDLSITMISATDFDGSVDVQDVNEVIDAALAISCKVNLVGFSFPSHIRRIAYETGGFVSEYPVNIDNGEWVIDTTSQISNAVVSMQNLDMLLSKDVKVHRAHYQFDLTSGTYSSGEVITYQFAYNGLQYFVDLRIP